MQNIKNTLIIFIGLVTAMLSLHSCKNSVSAHSNPVYLINLAKDINDAESILLSQFGSKLEYICLETASDCIIREISGISLSDSFLFVSDGYRLMQFDRGGKFVRLVGSQGRGPGEYGKIWDFAVNESDKEVFVLSSGRKMIIYDFDGEFLRDFVLGFASTQFVTNENNELVFHQINISQRTKDPVYSVHIVNSRGKTLSAIPNTLKRINGGIAIPESPLYTYEASLNFMEFGTDTLYNFDKNGKKPRAIFQYDNFKFLPDPTIDEIQQGDERLAGKFYINRIQETPKSFFLDLWYLFPNVTISHCVFDKSSMQVSFLKDQGFTNDIDGGVLFWPEKLTENGLMIDYADAFELVNWYKAKADSVKVSSPLESVVKSLTETSNPVIMVLYP